MGSSGEVPVIDTESLAARIHGLVNHARRVYGLAPYESDPALASLARAHSRDMAINGYFDHVNLKGWDPTARGAAAGFACSRGGSSYAIAENLYADSRYSAVLFVNGRAVSYNWTTEEALAEMAVTGWMNSPAHRQNLLDPGIRREGIGVAIADNDLVFITEDLC